MATLTIHLDEELEAQLRASAARHGRSMEAEAQAILRAGLTGPDAKLGLGSRIHQRFADMDDPEIPLPDRTELARAAEFPE